MDSSTRIKDSILNRIRVHETKEIDEKERKIKKTEETLINILDKEPRKRPKRSIKDAPERLNRTLFIGNVPSVCCTNKALQRELKAVFSVHGTVESIRYRSLALSEPMPRKHAFISGQLSEKIRSNNAYVVMKTCEEAQKSVVENGRLFNGHHLRVDLAGETSKLPSHKKSIFVGNLPLDVSEESLWTTFADCGEITSVRVVRDKSTGIGKGFAYVAFKDRATVKLGIMMEGTEIGGRKVRIQKCSQPGQKTPHKPMSNDMDDGDDRKPKFQKNSKAPFKPKSRHGLKKDLKFQPKKASEFVPNHKSKFESKDKPKFDKSKFGSKHKSEHVTKNELRKTPKFESAHKPKHGSKPTMKQTSKKSTK